MKISKRDQILLFGLVIILAVFAFYKFVYMPNRQEIQSLSTTKQELQQEKMRLDKIAKKPPAVRKDMEEKIADLSKRLPTEDELVPLLNVLDSNCQKLKVPFSSLEYRGADDKSSSGAQTLVFTIGTKGKVSQLFDFLKALETNERLISVLDVSLTAVKAEQKDTSTKESEPPTYYIAPPGIPEAKLQRVKFEVEKTEEESSGAEEPIATSFIPDSFDMTITINSYYAAQNTINQVSKTNDKADSKSTKNKETKAIKGEV